LRVLEPLQDQLVNRSHFRSFGALRSGGLAIFAEAAPVAMARKAMKKEAKIEMAAEGYVRGEQISEMNEMMMDSYLINKPKNK
jgi:hypothetical protein